MSVLNMRSVFIGILATLTMDVLGFSAQKLGFIAFLPPRLTGRWFASVARGQFLHSDIGQVPPIDHELAIAVPVHYAIGVSLALVYLLVCSASGLISSWLCIVHESPTLVAHVSGDGVQLVRHTWSTRNETVRQ